jgi:hypothetical protein
MYVCMCIRIWPDGMQVTKAKCYEAVKGNLNDTLHKTPSPNPTKYMPAHTGKHLLDIKLGPVVRKAFNLNGV